MSRLRDCDKLDVVRDKMKLSTGTKLTSRYSQDYCVTACIDDVISAYTPRRVARLGSYS